MYWWYHCPSGCGITDLEDMLGDFHGLSKVEMEGALFDER